MRDLLGFVLAGAIAERDRRACAGQLERDGAADPARAAGDESGLPLE